MFWPLTGNGHVHQKEDILMVVWSHDMSGWRKVEAMWLNEAEEDLVMKGNICPRKQMGPEKASGWSKEGESLWLRGNQNGESGQTETSKLVVTLFWNLFHCLLDVYMSALKLTILCLLLFGLHSYITYLKLTLNTAGVLVTELLHIYLSIHPFAQIFVIQYIWIKIYL